MLNNRIMKISKNYQKRAGFSMVEVLAVIMILAVLGSIGFGTFMLVNRNARVTQAEVMIENLTSQLEIRSKENFTDEQIQEMSDILEPGTFMPSGDGSSTSSENLYAYLSGDFDSNGIYEDGEGEPVIPELDPNYQGKGRYVNDRQELVDPWKTPIRYEFDPDGIQLNNNVEGGFDIWSAGPDKEFDTEDDINNW